MSNPEISVIVPIYNVEKYIGKCLESIKNQTFTDFEVLLIDDGSPDGSADIARSYCEKDKRFCLYSKKNGGLSDARNYGIERAKGEFVVFIDSDDYIHKDYLNVLYHECADNGADMAYCRFSYSLFGGKIIIPMIFAAGKEVMRTQDALNLMIRDNFLQSYAWNKMYRLSLFKDNNIRYPKMYFEDIATSARVLYHANKLAISNRYVYYYVVRSGSIMTTMNSRKINDLLRSLLITRDHIQRNGLYEHYRKSIRGVAIKMHFVNIYSILREHIAHFDFHGMGYNFRTNRELYKYITSDDYKPSDEFPDLPVKLMQPGKK